MINYRTFYWAMGMTLSWISLCSLFVLMGNELILAITSLIWFLFATIVNYIIKSRSLDE